jgi:TrmH family RNA methyltransferase
MPTTPLVIQSRDNPLLMKVRKLNRHSSGYRQSHQVWLEGDHLCRALHERGHQAQQAIVVDHIWDTQSDIRTLASTAQSVALVSESLFASISGLESPASMGFIYALPPTPTHPTWLTQPTVILDRLQDPGNAGSILRTSSAMGFCQIIALEGTVALWSPKVLRAGMGAHFHLRLYECVPLEHLSTLPMPIISTSSHAAQSLRATALPHPCAWVFGHEGQGIHSDWQNLGHQPIRIPQPGGEESLNVAAAAAICLYESSQNTLRT